MSERGEMKVLPITRDIYSEWILKMHYAKRMPSVSHAFGLFRDDILVGVVTYGSPASPFLCVGVCGEQWKNKVIELNRLVLKDNKKNEASYLIANTLKLLPMPSVVVSYADKEWGHVGIVYQATNWLYTGATKERTDMFSDSGHSRHNRGNPEIRQKRSSKHRYIFFVGNKRDKRKMREALRYDVLPYPKQRSGRYEIDYQLDGTQMRMPLLNGENNE